MDLEHLITGVLTGVQRQLKTCRIERNNKLNHRWSERIPKNQVDKRRTAFDGLVLSVDMRNACLPPHHPPFRNLHLLNPASVSSQTGNHNTHARTHATVNVMLILPYIFILITTLLMCSSDDLFLEDEDAVKSFSFHLKLVDVLT